MAYIPSSVSPTFGPSTPSRSPPPLRGFSTTYQQMTPAPSHMSSLLRTSTAGPHETPQPLPVLATSKPGPQSTSLVPAATTLNSTILSQSTPSPRTPLTPHTKASVTMASSMSDLIVMDSPLSDPPLSPNPQSGDCSLTRSQLPESRSQLLESPSQLLQTVPERGRPRVEWLIEQFERWDLVGGKGEFLRSSEERIRSVDIFPDA